MEINNIKWEITTPKFTLQRLYNLLNIYFSVFLFYYNRYTIENVFTREKTTDT